MVEWRWTVNSVQGNTGSSNLSLPTNFFNIMAHIFTFGKYKYQKVDDMIVSNPEYVDWARKHVPYFKLTSDEERRLNAILDTEDKYDISSLL